jgi:hypothetical protein
MAETESSFSKIRNIDNRGHRLPWPTILVLIILIVVLVWFVRGGTFVFYTSLFFGLYDLTKSAAISIFLVGLAQTLIFLPFRFIGFILHPDLKNFEQELEKTKSSDNQYILLHEKVRQGNSSVIFYMLNFVLLAIAFFSVGRVFLLDFYNHKIATHYLYKWIPYPDYPIQGTIFKFPWLKITAFRAMEWNHIFAIVGGVILFLVVLRLLWRIFRIFFKNNKKILDVRIQYNHFLFTLSGFAGVLLIAVILILRHIPTAVQPIFIISDLGKQNTGFNIITAICTFLATINAGYNHNKEAAKFAKEKGIPEEIISKVFREGMFISFRNGLLLALLTYWITRLMPCSHDLSVLSFEFLYLISPFTFDRLLPNRGKKEEPKPAVEELQVLKEA